MMKRTILLMVALLLSGLFFLTGCTESKPPGTDAKTDMALIKSALKKANRTPNPQTRIKRLRFAYENAEQLTTRWPDAEKVPAFLETYNDELSNVPELVYELSLQARDMDSFKWAMARFSKDYTQYAELLKIWKMGKAWRDYFISLYPEKTLSIFMNEAVEDYSVRFFNQYIGEFKATGYRLEFPLEKTGFFARFCHFFAEEIDAALKKADMERIGFLVDHMPSHDMAKHIDPHTEKTMRSLSDHVCHELKDEALACQLVELGYDMNRVDLDRTGFGGDFARVLIANPEHAITHVLKLNEWHGDLTTKEARFLLVLPDASLQSVHEYYMAEVIAASMQKKDTDTALRLIKLREGGGRLTPYEYDKLLGSSIEYKNRPVFDYVRKKCTQVDVYSLNLAELADNPHLFRLHAPRIFKKIYSSMDTRPRTDGTTFGRIREMLVTHHPEAALYVVENHDFGEKWKEVSENNRTLLMDVCEGGNLEAAKYLIENKGADIHAHTDFTESETTIFGRARTKEGRFTPMFSAAKSGNSELIRYLDSKKADVNACSVFGVTPLMYAVDNNRLEAVKTLISLGANVNAVMDDNLAASPELADMGSYENISTAYRRARKNGNQEILDVLKKAGARP